MLGRDRGEMRIAHRCQLDLRNLGLAEGTGWDVEAEELGLPPGTLMPILPIFWKSEFFVFGAFASREFRSFGLPVAAVDEGFLLVFSKSTVNDDPGPRPGGTTTCFARPLGARTSMVCPLDTPSGIVTWM